MQAIGVGQLGAGFIGRVHAQAYRTADIARDAVGAPVELVALADVDAALREQAAAQYGWGRTTADWRDVVADPAVTLFDNSGPNTVHGEPSIAAAAAGKHVLCEKPLAATADEALATWSGVAAAGVLHQCAFMYRFIPALRHARELIRGGELGEVLHVRGRFLLSFALDREIPMSWRLDKAIAGAGALGDLGSHHIDLARFLVAEVAEVAGTTEIFIAERPGGRVTNDDSFLAMARLENGATASFEGSRVAGNHALTSRVEVDGTQGSLAFDFERLNELSVSLRGQRGFRTYLATEAQHPFSDFSYPVGIQGQHPIGWDTCFAHQAHAMLSTIAAGREELPEGTPTFRDGYRVAEVVDAIDRASRTRAWETVRYREAGASEPAPA